MSRAWGVLGELRLPLALGLLRLSSEGRPPTAQALQVVRHALDRGIRVLDTADSYGRSDAERHFGELLLRQALSTWTGPRDEVRVITKVGLRRPRGRWRPAGSPAALREAVEGSLQALGLERLGLLLLHARDPQVPFAETLGALAELQREGRVEHLGLCNVTVDEVRQAQGHFTVSALQCELSVMNRKAATSGLVALAAQLGVPFLAHRPLGGHAQVGKLARNRAMKPLAEKHQVTPQQAALATLLDLDPPVLPLFGARRIQSVEATLQALNVRLDRADRSARAKISFEPTPEARRSLQPHEAPTALRPLLPAEPPGDQPEVVLVMGIQGAGKSSRVVPYLSAGYARLNRDEQGGRLADLIPQLEALLRAGQQRVVLDNTYPSWSSRAPVVRVAHRHGVPVRCIHLATPPSEALFNVVWRQLERYGRLLAPEELRLLQRTDPNLPPPSALASYSASFEAPSPSEGFGLIEEVPFVREPLPEFSGKGLLLDVDGTLRATRSGAPYPTHPSDVELLPGRRERLTQWIEQGYRLFLVSNQSGISSGKVTPSVVEACMWRTVQLLGLPITEIRYCPHPAFPAACYCRKPMPGFGVDLIRRYALSRSSLLMVGDLESDAAFAKNVGARFEWATEFFAG
ncbi:MAG TPA: oxidoreductase [Planctomycetes bacterium]|nr:oxidoreductase [Planctomycetota bacterium]